MKATVAVFVSALLFASTAFASEDLLDDLQSAIDADTVSSSDVVKASDAPPKREVAATANAGSRVDDSSSWSHVWE